MGWKGKLHWSLSQYLILRGDEVRKFILKGSTYSDNKCEIKELFRPFKHKFSEMGNSIELEDMKILKDLGATSINSHSWVWKEERIIGIFGKMDDGTTAGTIICTPDFMDELIMLLEYFDGVEVDMSVRNDRRINSINKQFDYRKANPDHWQRQFPKIHEMFIEMQRKVALEVVEVEKSKR